MYKRQGLVGGRVVAFQLVPHRQYPISKIHKAVSYTHLDVYKRQSLGFASALLMDALGVKGALLSILSLVPANLLLLPPLLIAGVSAVNLGITVIFSRPGSAKNCLRESAGNYIAFQLILSVFLLAGCLVESFICPFLQQLLI